LFVLVLLHIERERYFEPFTHMYQAFVMSCSSGNFQFLHVVFGQLLPKLSVGIQNCFLSAVSDHCTIHYHECIDYLHSCFKRVNSKTAWYWLFSDRNWTWR